VQSHKSIVHLSLTEQADKREGVKCPAEVTPERYFKKLFKFQIKYWLSFVCDDNIRIFVIIKT
jgi:hypothetical protein